MNNFYFVAGASGSGKTAIIPTLEQILDDGIALYDFDEIGVPSNADTSWRQEATENWLQKLFRTAQYCNFCQKYSRMMIC